MATMTSTLQRHAAVGFTDWRDGAWAGLIAGVVFLVLEMVLMWLVHDVSPWRPTYMIAAMVLGRDVLPQAGTWATFDLGIVFTALIVHFVLSVAYGLLGAWLFRRYTWAGGIIGGAIYGIAIYLINFFVFAPWLFPWFEQAQNLVTAFAHLMFGVTLGLAYEWLRALRPAEPPRPAMR